MLCEISKAAALERVTFWLLKDTLQNAYRRINNVHPMGYLRVNCTLQQYDEFLNFYGIHEGDGMYLAPEDRVAMTGISAAIIKKAAELSGEQPIAIASLMTAATAFIFLGMSGLGAIIMIGSIAIPIMTGAGIAAIDAVILILLGMLTGSALNFAGAATGIGIFGAEAVLRYLVPGAIVSVITTCAYILINIPRGNNDGASAFSLAKNFILAVLSVPGSLVSVVGKIFSQKKSTLMKKKPFREPLL